MQSYLLSQAVWRPADLVPVLQMQAQMARLPQNSMNFMMGMPPPQMPGQPRPATPAAAPTHTSTSQ